MEIQSKVIQRLPESLAQNINSQVNLSSIQECVIELVNNSIDANATNISIVIDIRRLSIKVTDNGEGISYENLENIAKFCHTAKWIEEDKPISTLGFKGLALASIASLSSVVITSRYQHDRSTNSVRIDFGERSPVYKSSEPKSSHGTTVFISSLFSTVPVRKKHILSQPDLSQIESLKRDLVPIAVSKPQVTISIHDFANKSFLYIPGIANSSISRDISTLKAVHGTHVAIRWQTVHAKVKDVNVTGTIAIDPIRGRQAQYIIINNHRLEDISVYNEINAAFTSMIPLTSSQDQNLFMVYIFNVTYPIVVSNLSSAAFNLEPTTEQIQYIKKLILALISKFLQAQGLEGNLKRHKRQVKPQKLKARKTDPTDVLAKSNSRYAFFDKKEHLGRVTAAQKEDSTFCERHANSHSQPSRLSLKPRPMERVEIKDPASPPLEPLDLGPASSKYFSSLGTDHRLEKKFYRADLKSIEFISQVDKKFLMVNVFTKERNKKCLAVIDQHAADERVMLEKFFNEITSKSLQETATPLAYPLKIYLSEDEYKFLGEYYNLFRQFGILFSLASDWSHLKEGKVLFLTLTHVPELAFRKVSPATGQINKEFAEKLVLGYTRDLMTKKCSTLPIDHSLNWTISIRNYPVALVELFQSKACRSAIKFGDELTKEQCIKLIENLSNCMFPFQCAHGRPSLVPLMDFS